MSVRIVTGDALAVLPQLAAEGVQAHAVVTDPPYGIGFMGRAWDQTGVAFRPETWAAIMACMRPGAHLVAFGSTRTFHRMACAIEDAGFEIRDTLCWLYGSGFPKSLDVSKAIDKAAGARGTFGAPKSAAHAGWIESGAMRGAAGEDGWQRPWMDDPEQVSNAARQYTPATPEASAWSGWGTALKPAFEPIILARKPLSERTVAANVLAHGCGGLNIEKCRVPHVTVAGGNLALNPHLRSHINGGNGGHIISTETERRVVVPDQAGRWPANVLHDGSDEVLAAFAAFGTSTSSDRLRRNTAAAHNRTASMGASAADWVTGGHADTGTAARFFFSAKADAADRAGSKHPTVKPTDLMRWLITLVCPPGGLVLDPFAGTGSTGLAADQLGMDAILIERDPQYAADAERKIVQDCPLFAEVEQPVPDLDAAYQRTGDLFAEAAA